MVIKNAKQNQDSQSILFNKTDVAKFNSAMSNISDEFGAESHTSASRYMDFTDIGGPGISSRPGLTRSDYEAFRPSEATPKKHCDTMKFAQTVYENNGLIKEMIDLMGDFGSQGIRISCADKREERFYKNWFTKVHGEDRTERFMNILYRLGNVIIRRQTATISRSNRAKLFAVSKPDIKVEDVPIKNAEIPWRYIFLNPETVDVLGGKMAVFADQKQYVIRFPNYIRNKVTSVMNGTLVDEEKLVKGLPPEIKQAIQNNGYYPLPKDKTLVFHYKKDDWSLWALPMVHSIADDIMMLEKLKLADIAALDGAISNIRIFKLGNIDPLIIPGKGAAAKLRKALASHTQGGTLDIVWDMAIDLIESKSEVYKFLGQEKYVPTMNNIYGGMGIPPTLTGSMSGGSGTTNNLISLQTLVQRLEYGRSVVTNFWNNELRIVKEAMGFTSVARVEFDYMELGDEASTKRLLIDLSDRGLISDELLKEKFKHNTELEDARIMRENKERENKTRPLKASPFFNAQVDEDLMKISVQKGYLTPEQVGLNMQELGKRVMEMDKTKTGVQGEGRPKNSKDTKKRKAKRFVPKSKASLDVWISEAQDKIGEFLNPAILSQFGKKNMRSLTAKEAKMAENIKFGVLLNVEPFESLSKEIVHEACSKDLSGEVYNQYVEMCMLTQADLKRDLTYEDMKHIQRHIYENYC